MEPEPAVAPVVDPAPSWIDARCPDCYVPAGIVHVDGCDVARCLLTGQQRLLHVLGGVDHDCGRQVWIGEWPGVAECREFGWWSRWDEGSGWVSCASDAPGATEDLNRLHRGEAVWDQETQRWQLKALHEKVD